MKNFLILLITGLFLIPVMSCGTREEPGKEATAGKSKNTPPVVSSVTITPDVAYSDTTLKADVKGYDKDRDAITYTFEWEVNGEPVFGIEGPSLDPAHFSKGYEVKVYATPFDGKQEGETAKSAIKTISNKPPRVDSIELEPKKAYPADAITVIATGSDLDGDDVSFRYKWIINGKELEEPDTSELRDVTLKKGDHVVAVAFPSDGESEGKPIASSVLLIQNRLPTITSNPPSKPSKPGFYTYHVTAEDPDNDQVSFYLSSDAPDGMVIDKNTGLISWKIPEKLAGPHEIKVTADDGSGGRCTQTITLSF